MMASLPSQRSDTTSTAACELCGLKLPRRPFVAQANGVNVQFCCGGCQHVFLLLSESGLLQGDYKNSDLYQTSLRLGIIGKPQGQELSDEPDPAALEGTQELDLAIDGMWCSSCSWLIEHVVGSEPGIAHVRVLYASDTAKVFYRPEQIVPEKISDAIGRLGYKASPRGAEDAYASTEDRSLLLKMGVALFAMMNVMMFSYVLYFGYIVDLPPEVHSLFPFILLGFATPTVFWCGAQIHKKAWRSILALTPTMEVLFSTGIIASYLYSVHEMIRGGDHFYFDTSVSLTALLLVGKFIEMSAKHRATGNIHRLYQMLPKKVRVRAPEGERLVGIEKLEPGDHFLVKSGEKIPADGKIVTGHAIVDESLLTGESKPVEKNVGAEVVASSMLVNGFIEAEALRIGRETIVSSVIALVEKALARRSELQQTVDQIARVFIPAVLVLSVAVGTFLLLTGTPFEPAMLRAITVLVIACPCVLGMATPLAVAAGIGYAARQGILIRSSAVFQRAGKTRSIVFDKTGTLTEGAFKLLAVHANGIQKTEALRLAASLEQSSGHPIALAITRSAADSRLELADATEVRIVDGQGITGIVDGLRVVLGNGQFLREAGFSIPAATEELSEREAQNGNTIVFFGLAGMDASAQTDTRQLGYFALGDTLKPTAAPAIERLKALGVTPRLLSGDMEGTTAAIARRAGIDFHTAQALPEGKINAIKKIQDSGETVTMVGDGVNDAPALAQADIGIALSSGTDIAVESASVTLLRDDLMLVPEAIEISRRTVRTIRQNLCWAFLYNSIGIILAVLGMLAPLIAAAAMLASSLSVALNSMRLSHPKGEFKRRLVEILLPWLEPKG